MSCLFLSFAVYSFPTSDDFLPVDERSGLSSGQMKSGFSNRHGHFPEGRSGRTWLVERDFISNFGVGHLKQKTMKKCCWLYASGKVATYAACFIGKTAQELVDEFNAEVGRDGLTQDRVYYREALVRALEERGVDVSAVRDGDLLRFDRPVRLDDETRTLCRL